MTPYEATLEGLESGAASMRIELDNGTIKVYHGEDGKLLMHVSRVAPGTWDKIWGVLEECGEIEVRVL